MNQKAQVLRARCVSGVISTDDIIPGRYKHMYTDPKKLAKHVFESRIPGFAKTLQPGDAIVATETFGIGSSREQAVSSLIAAGIDAVFAPHFGRIFFRNAWNLGLVAIEVESLSVQEKGNIELDLYAGMVKGRFGTKRFPPPPAAMLEMVSKGGLLAMLASHVGSSTNNERAPSAREALS